MDVLEAIRSRRSISRVRQDVAPPREVIEQLLQAAVEAPNHYLTEPWRFFVLTEKAREAFGAVHAEALQRRSANLADAELAQQMAHESAKLLRSPVLIVVGVKQTSEEDWRRTEDLQASSAAIENLLLAAHALGLAAVWRTGFGAFDDFVKGYLGLDASDNIAGIVYLGYPADDFAMNLKPRERRFAERTQWLDG